MLTANSVCQSVVPDYTIPTAKNKLQINNNNNNNAIGGLGGRHKKITINGHFRKWSISSECVFAVSGSIYH